MDELKLNKIKTLSKKMRKNILEMSLHAGADSSHFGGGLSIVEIISTLFFEIMNINKDDSQDQNRDRFILSKGHGVLAYYAALNIIGYISDDELKKFEKTDSFLFGHPVMNREKGIEFSNGSLGMGLSLGIGVALAAKRNKKKFHTYVIIGDGECNEGSVWEAAICGANYKLTNLTVIIDNNKFQQTGSNDEIMRTDSLFDKWKSFGWDTVSVNGHNIREISNILKKDRTNPLAIIADTIKGKGFSFSENNNDWHHKILSKSNYDSAILELENDI